MVKFIGVCNNVCELLFVRLCSCSDWLFEIVVSLLLFGLKVRLKMKFGVVFLVLLLFGKLWVLLFECRVMVWLYLVWV